MTKATISINLFSGRRNPSWVLQNADGLLNEILSIPIGSMPNPNADVDDLLQRPDAGFRGFDIAFSGTHHYNFSTYEQLIVDTNIGQLRKSVTNNTLELQVYQTAPAQVHAQLANKSYAELIVSGNELPIAGLVGPDHRLACESSPPFTGNTGPWKTNQLENNCYNYGTAKLSTVDVAIPGPGDVLLNSPLTAGRLNDALVADKLVFLGKTLPAACPPEGTHFLAVVLRHHPSGTITDFHCIRLDRGGAWSHKDGKGKVRNVDDAGQAITDLTTARFKWSPTIVGIYRADFSKRNLID